MGSLLRTAACQDPCFFVNDLPEGQEIKVVRVYVLVWRCMDANQLFISTDVSHLA